MLSNSNELGSPNPNFMSSTQACICLSKVLVTESHPIVNRNNKVMNDDFFIWDMTKYRSVRFLLDHVFDFR